MSTIDRQANVSRDTSRPQFVPVEGCAFMVCVCLCQRRVYSSLNLRNETYFVELLMMTNSLMITYLFQQRIYCVTALAFYIGSVYFLHFVSIRIFAYKAIYHKFPRSFKSFRPPLQREGKSQEAYRSSDDRVTTCRTSRTTPGRIQAPAGLRWGYVRRGTGCATTLEGRQRTLSGKHRL